VVDEQVDVVERGLRGGERLVRRLGHAGDGVLEDLLALHPDPAVGVRGVQEVALRLRAQEHRTELAGRVRAGEHGGAGAVGEQHRGLLVRGVDELGEVLGADHQHGVRAAGLEHRRAELQPAQEAGAGGVDVQAGGAAGAEQAGDGDRGGRQQVVGRARRHEHHVDVTGRDAGVVERGLPGLRGQRRELRALGQHAALADPGAGQDPLLVLADLLGDLGVSDDDLRDGDAEARDRGAKGSPDGPRGRGDGRGLRHARAPWSPSRSA
jgi:hypothetical protein